MGRWALVHREIELEFDCRQPLEDPERRDIWVKSPTPALGTESQFIANQRKD